MPPLDPRARYPQGNVRLSIPTLNGGVGRRAPTKRAVNEAQNMDNVLCTLERSAEKRSPMAFIRRYTDGNFGTLDDNALSELDFGSTSSTADFFFYWFSISDEQRYIVAIDYSNSDPNTFMSVYRTTSTGFYKCNVPNAADFHDYLTYGYTQGFPNPLKAITIGPQLILLNTQVHAGYSSVEKEFNGGTSLLQPDGSTVVPEAGEKRWCKIGFNGNFKLPLEEDGLGRKLTYFTTTPVDTQGEATIYVQDKYYITNDQAYVLIDGSTALGPYGYVSGEDEDLDNFVTGGTLDSPQVLVFTCIKEGPAEGEVPDATSTEGSEFKLRDVSDGGALAKYIPVEDWRYPDVSKASYGQSLSDFSEFQFPPEENDVSLTSEGVLELNKPPIVTENYETLAALYPEQLGAGKNGRGGGDAGRGKIYSVDNSYAGEDPGFYIIRNADEKPYVMKIRSPLEYSVFDRDRFPKILKIDSIDPTTKVETFNIQNFEMEHRTAGSLKSNPGPEAFKDGTQIPIKSMAFFRDRLFLSAGDVVFSSKTRDFTDFWVTNPSTVSDRDPIDIRLSTNKYTPVSTMTPFQQYLFINTESDVQFTMQGSENRITPLNAEISPTAFYSTSPLVDPILLGSQIYFFAPRRSYIYFNDSTVSVNQAVETSLNCPDYLPTNFGHTTVVPGYDTILMLDEDNSKFLYLYTNRYSGGQVAQNAFFRYIYRVDIEHVESFDNDMYFITKQPDGGGFRYNLGYQKFREEDAAVPLLDNYVTVGGPADEGTVVYDSVTDTTVWTIPKFFNLNPEFLYVNVAENDPASGEVINILPEQAAINNGTVTITLPGDQTYEGRRWTVGTGYTMNIELSPQFFRDQEQNAYEGVLSLRTMSTQHFNTGAYRVEKDINGRRSTTMTFTPQELDAKGFTSGFDVPLPLYESRGETFSKIMGFSADTRIFIVSDYAAPCNITQIELKGRFTGKSSGFVR